MADNTRWFLFGSSAQRANDPEDVDLLIVYAHENLNRIHELVSFIENHGPVPPPDLVLLSTSEERQVQFAESERALQIWPS